ncbi:MAG: hypothetical protein KGJ98_10630 [Chloroflexota bacterium]|nr:hypothetical protein [Chloroflexota bacterium]MDE3102677.1 hypothetical protein [Chloroflexota bacterium]
MGITRHQLLVDPRIPYTSHNSSACLALAVAEGSADRVVRAAGELLARRAPPGSDPGLCLAAVESVSPGIAAFGRDAKREIVTREAAERLARDAGVHLSAHGGTGLGVIGALAAVGLRGGGSDGRFLELGDLRRMRGEVSAGALRASGIARFERDALGVDLTDDEIVRVGDWCRPVLRDGVAVLLLTEVSDGSGVRWACAPRDLVRSY